MRESESTVKRGWLNNKNLVGAFLGLVALMGGLMDKALALVKFGATSAFDFVNDPIGSLLIVLGLVTIVIFAILLAARAIPAHPKAVGGVIGLVAVLLIFGFIVAQVTPTPGSIAPPPAAAALSSYLVSPGEIGCTVNNALSTPAETCTEVYNYTSNAFVVSAANSTIGGVTWTSTTCTVSTTHCANWILVNIHSARTDVYNSTYGFPYQITLVPTFSTVSSPTAYSPALGYVAASGTTPGIWKVYPGVGSSATLNPNVAAPGVTSNLGVDQVGIAAFGSASVLYHFSLPGGNSTTAPLSGTTPLLFSSTSLAQYQTFTYQISVGNSSPALFDLIVQVIGQHV
ncbi:MAG: hypothetical protein WCB19_05730 [Thermoplasmata archaeon]